MSGFFGADIETLSVESTCVVLSISMIHVDGDKLPKDNTKAYYQMLDSACTVKFNASEQIKAKRHVDKNTVDWWVKQCEPAKEMSFYPLNSDKSVAEGSAILHEWFYTFPNAKNLPIWVRGSMDQPAYSSLLRSNGLPDLAPYNNFRDVRTAVELMYPDSKAGYVDVPNFDTVNVIKHMPNHDVAYDLLMLLRGDQIPF
jgi:hypothetical protein